MYVEPNPIMPALMTPKQPKRQPVETKAIELKPKVEAVKRGRGKEWGGWGDANACARFDTDGSGTCGCPYEYDWRSSFARLPVGLAHLIEALPLSRLQSLVLVEHHSIRRRAGEGVNLSAEARRAGEQRASQLVASARSQRGTPVQTTAEKRW